MSRISVKKDYEDGQVLRGQELNINNEVIELGVNDNFDRIESLDTLKADKLALEEVEVSKVDVTTFNESIINLTNVKANRTELNNKANKSDLDIKADKSYVDNAVSSKADVNYVNTQLNYKANKSEVDDALATKFDKTSAGNLNNLKTPDKSNLVNAINSIAQENLPIATVDNVGAVKPDGVTITVDVDGTIHSIGGGGGGSGTTDYNALTNRPSINDVLLSGNKSLEELDIASATSTEASLLNKANKSDVYTKSEADSNLATALESKADTSYVNSSLEGKANKIDVYTRTEVDNAILESEGNINSQIGIINTTLGNKADKATTYTKSEVDNLIQEQNTGITVSETEPEAPAINDMWVDLNDEEYLAGIENTYSDSKIKSYSAAYVNGTILYENETGSEEDVPLNLNGKTYKYLRINYKVVNVEGTIIVPFVINGEFTIHANVLVTGEDYIRNALYTISNSNLTLTYVVNYHINGVGFHFDHTDLAYNEIYITKVEGLEEV